MRWTLPMALLATTAPALAQDDDLLPDLDPGAVGAQTVEEVAVEGDDDGPLRGTVTDDSAWQNLGIAIASFAYSSGVPKRFSGVSASSPSR